MSLPNPQDCFSKVRNTKQNKNNRKEKQLRILEMLLWQLVFVVGLLTSNSLGVLNGVPSTLYDTRPLASVISRFPNIPDGQAMICGGVVITPNTILTAAHCVNDGNTFPSMVTVTLNEGTSSSSRLRQFTRAIDLHSGYSEASHPLFNLRLTAATLFSSGRPQIARLPPLPHDDTEAPAMSLHFNPAKNPILDKELETSFCFATGWGITEDGTYSDTPQNIYLRVKRENSDDLFGYPINIASKACKGDSGSPVYCYVRGVKYLIGVMTDVGTYKEIKRSANDEMRCEDYDFVVIADIRDNIDEIRSILRRRGLLDSLATGQRLCHNVL
ncbi:hypothetical protein Q1695_006901 [Nippostrongylus brasiliensis]|nr:hypothetical protein Q1695_006901 [Nippostrongylus brasiliensis]